MIWQVKYNIRMCLFMQLKAKDGITWLLANPALSLNYLLDDVISMVSITSPTTSSNAELIIGRLVHVDGMWITI